MILSKKKVILLIPKRYKNNSEKNTEQSVSFPKPTVIHKAKEKLLNISCYQKKQIETHRRSKRTISYSHSG